MSYLFCQQKAKFQFILEQKQEDTPELIKGRYFHDEAAKFWEKIDYNSLAQEKDLLSYFCSLLPKEEMFRNLAGFEVKRYEMLKDKSLFKPFIIESRFESKLSNTVGIIDRVEWLELNGEKIPLIVEYKTGKYKPTQLSKLRLELAFYARLLRETTEFKANYGAVLFPVANKTFFTKLQSVTFVSLDKKLNELKNSIERNEFKISISPYTCGNCSFLEMCPAKEDLMNGDEK